MSLIKKYIAYLKDNPEGYWFKRKVFGWGWVPVRWQGWLVTAIFAALLVYNFLRIDAGSHSASDTLRPFLLETAVLVFVFILICMKTGEKPRWQWGFEEKEHREN